MYITNMIRKPDKRLIKAKNPVVEDLKARGFGKGKRCKRGNPKGTSRSNPLALTPEILDAAERAAALAMPDYMIATVLGISAQTMSIWAGKHPEFVQAVTRGRGKRLGELVESENELADGITTGMVFPADRLKVIDRLISRLYPESLKQPIIINTAAEEPKSKAQEVFDKLKDIFEDTLTKDKSNLSRTII